ncbi:flagellar hook-length control protein FliK [Paenibacillus illinoisensis]|uniref:flagellar hook-length control protein FliK n=1 Tax=Paenibacillus illinoisensis TaxID=59845 RepID=UPI002041484F|nr:flagellar hook-length control protein FliK [Paenibacillus illinoisensis]MCM3205110.1 flagellar hook-length control protein FliK [Paenibacillus illinoisensis]
MSIVNQVTSTSSAVSASQGIGSKGKAVTGASGVFGQSLSKSMNGEMESAQTSSLTLEGGNSLFSLISNEDEEDTLIKIVDSIFSDRESLDLAFENNPEMLQNLEALIQQIYSLLNGMHKESPDNPELVNANSITSIDLSEHPTVARFVLQDALTQIITIVREPKILGVKEQTEFRHLIQQIQNQLQDSGMDVTNEGWKALNSLLSSEADAEIKTSNHLEKFEQIKLVSSQNPNPHNDLETATSEIFDVENDQGIITAGELSLRTSGTKILKSAEPVMQASNFAKDMTQFVVGKLDIVQKDGLSEAIISLRPEHLGKLDVQISMQNGHLVARFMTEHTMAKDLLEQQIMQLRTSLQSQGIQVERIEVTQNSSLGSQMNQDGGRQSGGHSQQQRRSREREEHSEEAILTASIQEELRNWRSDHEEENLVVRDSFTAEA